VAALTASSRRARAWLTVLMVLPAVRDVNPISPSVPNRVLAPNDPMSNVLPRAAVSPMSNAEPLTAPRPAAAASPRTPPRPRRSSTTE
jgi:hypothetical protein